MPARIKTKPSVIEALRQKLMDAPEKDTGLDVEAACASLQPAIKAYIAKDYSIDETVEMLMKSGLVGSKDRIVRAVRKVVREP